MKRTPIPQSSATRRFLRVATHVILVLAISLLHPACSEDNEEDIPPTDIVHVIDGRTVRVGDPQPIALDVNADQVVDFTIFQELTANASGDHLYAGINPIGPHLVKSGPPDDERFLNMGLVIAELGQAVIDSTLAAGEIWTGDHSALVIRHTPTAGAVWHEGGWATGTDQMCGVRLWIDGQTHYGWLRIRFDKATEILTLVDFAYERTPGRNILAGDF